MVVAAVSLPTAAASRPVTAVAHGSGSPLLLADLPASSVAGHTATVHFDHPIQMAQVSWPGTAVAGVLVRGLGPAGWTPWTDLDGAGDDMPDASTAATPDRTFAGPVWLGTGTTDVQVRVAEGRAPSLRVEGVDASDRASTGATTASTGTSGTGTTAAVSAAAPPPVRARSAWGAAPFSYANCPEGIRYDPLRMAIVHHTATANTYTRSEVDDQIRAIQAFHINSRGWCDIAYNFIVDRFGQIWEARAGGGGFPVRGGHARGFNTGSVGVSLLGNFQSGTSGAVSAPAVAIEGAARVIAWKFSQHNLNPTGTFTTVTEGSTKYADGTTVTLPRIAGHRDIGSTSCPGNTAYDDLPAIRTAVAHLKVSPSTFHYGSVGDQPIIGDWDGDGDDDIGVRRANVFLLRLGRSSGSAQLTFVFGRTSDRVLIGDWNGDGIDTVALQRDRQIFWRDTNATISPSHSFSIGRTGDLAVGGDWNRDGQDTVSLFRAGQVFIFDHLGGGTATRSYFLGQAGDVPFATDTNANGVDEVNLRRGQNVLYGSPTSDAGRNAWWPGGPTATFIGTADWARRGFPLLVVVDPTLRWGTAGTMGSA